MIFFGRLFSWLLLCRPTETTTNNKGIWLIRTYLFNISYVNYWINVRFWPIVEFICYRKQERWSKMWITHSFLLRRNVSAIDDSFRFYIHTGVIFTQNSNVFLSTWPKIIVERRREQKKNDLQSLGLHPLPQAHTNSINKQCPNALAHTNT